MCVENMNVTVIVFWFVVKLTFIHGLMHFATCIIFDPLAYMQAFRSTISSFHVSLTYFDCIAVIVSAIKAIGRYCTLLLRIRK